MVFAREDSNRLVSEFEPRRAMRSRFLDLLWVSLVMVGLHDLSICFDLRSLLDERLRAPRYQQPIL